MVQARNHSAGTAREGEGGGSLRKDEGTVYETLSVWHTMVGVRAYVILALAVLMLAGTEANGFMFSGRDAATVKVVDVEEEIRLGRLVHGDVEEVQRHATTWVAGENERFQGLTFKHVQALCGSRTLPKHDRLKAAAAATSAAKRSTSRATDMPSAFDSRKAWPHCKSISTIRDQGHCGSCWAFGAVEALTDRFCIADKVNVSLSANDVLSCCSFCGDGCEGGYPFSAWEYFAQKGVVDNACDPYFDQKGCQHPGCEPVAPTPQCSRQCNAKSGETWSNAKYTALGRSVRYVGSEEDIMAEIQANGPVTTSFDVYEDFANYKSGVYKHVHGGLMGGHAVKIIGWGEDAKAGKYWIVANSWNTSWGMDGYFFIARGDDECGIESGVIAGMPNKEP